MIMRKKPAKSFLMTNNFLARCIDKDGFVVYTLNKFMEGGYQRCRKEK